MPTETVIRNFVIPERPKTDRPRNPLWDRFFFSGMIVLLWLTILFGFSKTYYRAGMLAAPLPNRLVHIHAAAFTLWMILLVVQTGLIAGGKVHWHRRLGVAGFALAASMVVLGVMAANDQFHRASGAPGVDPCTFYVVPISAISLFAVFVFLACRMRRQPGAHKRLILIATISIANAAIARWPVAAMETNPFLPSLVIFGFLAIIALYDLVSLGRVLPVTRWASVLLIAVHLLRFPVATSQPWLAMVAWLFR